MLPWPWKLGVGRSGIAPPLLHQGTRQSSQFSTSTFRPGKAGSPSSENLELIFENNFSDKVVAMAVLVLLPQPCVIHSNILDGYFNLVPHFICIKILHKELLAPNEHISVFLFNCKLTGKNRVS